MAATMTTKVNTKTWSDTPSAKAEPQMAKLTEEQKKQVGAEDLQAVLNKASDPNWTDSSRKVQGHGNANLDKDAFFKLMLTQLKNQDPMNPLKNHEMAAQLAQFSTLEQMNNMNSTLTKIEGKNSEPQNFQALNLIGKTVAGDSSKVTRTQFDKAHEFNFTAPQELTEANVKVLNQKGESVREYRMNNLKAGANKISWNGETDSGEKAQPGDYQFKITATGKGGQKLNVKTDFEGQITGISFSAEGPVLQVGSQSLKMRDVRQITDPSTKKNDQNVTDVTNLDLKSGDSIKQNNIKKDANTSANVNPIAGGGDVMQDVAMSRELMNQLQKAETKVGSK
jgi:flagellar basal-body rod modification protein FlgD